MAINVDISKITGINQVGNSYQRKSAVPLDYYSLFNTKTEAENYAASNPVAYVGQVISYIDNNEVNVCVIENTAGNLKKVGTAPIGDNKTIEVSAEGAVALLGAATAENGTLPMLEDGALVWKTLKDIGAGDGNDNTTYEFVLNEAGTGFIVTPKFNGQPIMDGENQVKYELDFDAKFVTHEELTAAIEALPEDKDTTYTAKAEDKLLRLNGTEFYTEIGLKHENGKISLTGVDGVVIAEFSDAEFVADGVLEDVSYDADKKELTFTWNIKDAEGKTKTDVVNIADLIDTYVAGNGLTLTNSTFSIKVDTTSENFLSVDENGIKVSGIQNAINAALDVAKQYANSLEHKNTTYTLTQEGMVITLTPSEGAAQTVTIDAYTKKETEDKIDEKLGTGFEKGAQVNKIESISVNGVAKTPDANKNVDIKVPTAVSELENDKNYLVNVRAKTEIEDGEGGYVYQPKIKVETGTGENGQLIRVIDDSELQNDIKKAQEAADKGVEGATFAGQAFTKNNKHLTITKEQAITALGLKALAFEESVDTGVHSVELVPGTENGTVKVKVDGVEGNDVKVTGLGTAAYKNEDAFDAKGAAADVLGKETDAAGAATVHGALNKAAEVLGKDTDGATANTVYGVKAALAALSAEGGAVKALQDAVALLNKTDGTVGSVKKTVDDAISALSADGGAIKALADLIAILVGTDANKSVRQIANEELVAQLVAEDAAESLNELKEIADWIQSHPGDAAALNSAIKAIYNAEDGTGRLTDEIARLEAKIFGVDDKTIKLKDNKAYVAEVSTDILTQGEQTLIFCAGTASTVI